MKVSLRFKFDSRKAVEVLLYIAERVRDTYHALKVLYFADKEHLARYGRLICGDTYIAMDHGPVPSGAYDLVKQARSAESLAPLVNADCAFSVVNYYIVPKRQPDLDLLSDSDVECLDAAIERYGRLSFGELKEISHREPAFRQCAQNDPIPWEAIIRSMPEGDLLLEHLLS